MVIAMLQNEFLSQIAQLLADAVDYGLLGTGTTTPTADDGELEAPDANTVKTIEKTTSGNSVKFVYTLKSTDVNGTYTEFGLKSESGTAGTFICRDLFPEITKDSTVDFVIEKTVFVQ